MSGKLQAEIRQTKPFRHVEEEAWLNIIRTAAVLEQRLAEALRPEGLSMTQYNVLRILRGSAPAGLNCGDIGDRMIARDPDVTRLIDRLEKRDLVERRRSTQDRRQVAVHITEAGLDLLTRLDGEVDNVTQTAISPLEPAQMRVLIELLEIIRK